MNNEQAINQNNNNIKRPFFNTRDKAGGMIFLCFILLTALGVLAITYYADGSELSYKKVFPRGLFMAGAASACGALLGLLFGIPRSNKETQKHNVSNSALDNGNNLKHFFHNTNLEEISDWLTKMLVGVGISQLALAGTTSSELALKLSIALDGSQESGAFALGLVIYHSVTGFLFSYLIARLYLLEVFSDAEETIDKRLLNVESMIKKVPESIEKIERNALEVAETSRKEINQTNTLSETLRKMHANLYIPYSGYQTTLELADSYMKEYTEPKNSSFWIYVACAYGQQYRDELIGEVTDSKSKELEAKALNAVQKALEYDPLSKPLLQYLFSGTDPRENDLASFRDNPDFRNLLG